MENLENLERAGAILTLIGVIWIAVVAFQAGDIFWGIFEVICPIIVALIYGFLHFNNSDSRSGNTIAPVILIIVGVVLGGAKLTQNVL
jgi:carbon starvation protein CstA